MSEVIRIKLEAHMIISMHHLMRQRILKMSFIPEFIRADQNPIFRIKPSTLRGRTPSTSHITLIDRCASVLWPEEVYFLFQEADDGRVFEEPEFVLFAARAVALFVQGVADVEVFFAERGRGVAGHYAEERGPGVD